MAPMSILSACEATGFYIMFVHAGSGLAYILFVSQIILIALKIRVSVSPEKIQTLSNECENSLIASDALYLHSEERRSER